MTLFSFAVFRSQPKIRRKTYAMCTRNDLIASCSYMYSKLDFGYGLSQVRFCHDMHVLVELKKIYMYQSNQPQVVTPLLVFLAPRHFIVSATVTLHQFLCISENCLNSPIWPVQMPTTNKPKNSSTSGMQWV